MKFEGDKIEIPILGIDRHGKKHNSKAGNMDDMYGLRWKDGHYMPYNMTISEICSSTGYNYHPLKVHKMKSVSNMLFIDADGVVIKWGKIGNKVVDLKDLRTTGNKIDDIAFLSNIICVSVNDAPMEYYVWSDSKQLYEHISTEWQTDELPRVDFRTGLGVLDGGGMGFHLIDEDLVQRNEQETYEGSLNKILTISKDRGGLTGYVLVAYAFRLKNGEICNASSIKLMNPPQTTSLENGIIPESLLQDSKSFFRERPKPNLSFVDFCKLPNDNLDRFAGKIEEISSNSKFGLYKPEKESDKGFTFKYQNVDYQCPALWLMKTFYNYGNTIWGARDIYCLTNKLQFAINKKLPDRSEIQSVCIFMSKEIMPWKIKYRHLNRKGYEVEGTEKGYDYVNTMYNIFPTAKTTSELKKEIDDIENLYLIEEIPIDNIDTSGWIDIDLKGKLGDGLLVRESLPLTSFDMSVIYGGKLKSYNGRLHCYDYVRRYRIPYTYSEWSYFSGYGQLGSSLTTVNNDSQNPIRVVVEVKISDGIEKRVLRHYYEHYGAGQGIFRCINSLISFPIENATEMSIYAQIPSLNSYYYLRVPLRKHKRLPISYYLRDDLSTNEIKSADINSSIFDNVREILQGNVTAEDSINENYKKNTSNEVTVSDTYYPMYFPLKSIVTVGNGGIVAIGRLGIALKHDTFGSYPLIVFCNDGIYGLGVDTSGNTAYRNVSWMSREVLINKDAMCETDRGIVFISSHGLMLLDANGVEKWRNNLDGAVSIKADSNLSYGNGAVVLRNIIQNYSLLNMTSFDRLSDELLSEEIELNGFDGKDIRGISNIKLSYVGGEDALLLWFDNETYYIDMESGITSRLAEKIESEIEDYPRSKFASLHGSKWFIMDLGSEANDSKVYILSRPIKLTENALGGIYRICMRCYLSGDSEKDVTTGKVTMPNGQQMSIKKRVKKRCGLYAFGSLDGEHWQLLGGKEEVMSLSGKHDIGMTTYRSSMKYLIIVFAGELMADSYINGIELTSQLRYNNKLK